MARKMKTTHAHEICSMLFRDSKNYYYDSYYGHDYHPCYQCLGTSFDLYISCRENPRSYNRSFSDGKFFFSHDVLRTPSVAY